MAAGESGGGTAAPAPARAPTRLVWSQRQGAPRRGMPPWPCGTEGPQRGVFSNGAFRVNIPPRHKRFQDFEIDSSAKVVSVGRPPVQFAASSKTKDRTSLIMFTLATVRTPLRSGKMSVQRRPSQHRWVQPPLRFRPRLPIPQTRRMLDQSQPLGRRTGAPFGVQRSLTAAVQPPFSDKTTCSTSSRMKSSTREGGHP